jgi:hypothetical protein
MHLRNSVFQPLTIALAFGTFIAAVDAFFTRGLANDLTEATFWGHELVSVTDKHPAGFGLVHYFWSAAFSYNEFLVLMLGVANLIFCIWILWLVLKELGWPAETRLFPIFLALASFNSYLLLIKYNGNSAPAPFWLLAMLLLLWLQKRPSILIWIALGIVCAIAVFMKYQTALLLLTIVGYALTSPRTRQWFLTPGPYVSIASFLILLLPHALEMIRYDLPGLSYGINNVVSSTLDPLVGRLVYPAKFALIQFLFAMPGLAVALYWSQRRRVCFELSEDARRFLLWFGLIFPLSPCLVGIVTGGELGSIWGVGASFLIVPFVLSRTQTDVKAVGLLMVGQRTILVTFTVFGLLFLVAQPFQVHSNPKKELASVIEVKLIEMQLTAPRFVFSRSHSVSALNFYMSAHPRIIRGADWESQPWTTENREHLDPVLIQLPRSETAEDVALRLDVQLIDVLEVNIPPKTDGFSKHGGFNGIFLYGYYAP